MYDLGSRFYDPVLGRFLNADGAISGISGEMLGYNMYAYCMNNPVNMSDSTGNWPKLSTIFTGVAVAALAVATVAVCVAAAPVVAGVGVAGGAAAASVATISAGVAAISATAAVVTKKAESTLKKKANEKHIVYGLKDSSENIQYVGRTKHITARKNAHQANPARKELKMIILADNLSYEEARGIEQVYMLYYHTINTKNAMNNQINGISPYNKKLGSYLETAKGALGYLWNQVSNEVLC